MATFGKKSPTFLDLTPLTAEVGLGIGLLTAAGHRLSLVAFVAVYGLTFGGPLALIPLVIAEIMGLKRFGSLSGLIGIFHTAGAAIGPLTAGRVFDLNGSYSSAFELFVVLLIVGSTALLGCAPLPAEESAVAPIAARM